MEKFERSAGTPAHSHPSSQLAPMTGNCARCPHFNWIQFAPREAGGSLIYTSSDLPSTLYTLLALDGCAYACSYYESILRAREGKKARNVQ